MPSGDWERAVGTFASSTDGTITGRDEVAGNGAATWLLPQAHGWTWRRDDGIAGADYWPAYDAWNSWNYRGLINSRPNSFVLGVNMDWAKWGNEADGPLAKFTHAGEILNAVNPPNENDTTSSNSFSSAAFALQGVDEWLQDWMPTIRGWSDELNVSGGNWNGSAASEFKWMLDQFHIELQKMHLQLTNAPYLEDLGHNGDVLWTATGKVNEAFQTWFNSLYAWPVNCVENALYLATRGKGPDVTLWPDGSLKYFTFNTPLGEVQTQEFWDNLEAAAKQIWMDNVHTLLDSVANTWLGRLDSSYATSISDFSRGLQPVSLGAPPAPDLNTLGGGNTDLKTPGGGNTDLNTLGGGNSNLNTLGGGNSNLNVPGGLNSPSTISGGNQGTPILDSKGNPVMGPDGKPLTLPPGGYIGAGGQLFGADGKPVMINGKSVNAPKGSRAAPSDTPNGGNAMVPPDSTIGKDGTVTDLQGHTVLDANGNPVVLAKGDKIAADGTVLSPDGKPVSASAQQLANEQARINTQGTLQRPTTSFSEIGNGPGLLGATGIGGGSLGVGDAGRLIGTSRGMSPAALANGGVLPEGAAAEAGKTAAEMAAAEPEMAGQGVSTMSEPPMIPPMGGMGMGGGLGGAQAEKDRQRTTWLAEDEEVWGTESGTISGVIGR
ncbi:hypothetical protein ACWD7F_34145 [Streptomyces sp. NPDC005122]